VSNGAAPRVLSQAGFLAGLDALIAVYGLAMRPPPQQLQGRRSIMERHAGYSAFRAVTVARGDAQAGARASAEGGAASAEGGAASAEGGAASGEDSGDGSGPDSQVVAFAYGFRGAGGQWWHDVVRSGITAAAGDRAAAAWLADAFEIAEVHVRPEYQHQGIGRAMLLSLTAGCPYRTAVLSTLDAASPARQLYGSLGFTDLLTGFSFPGNGPPYVVMGAPLPLRDRAPGPPRPSR
jgi:ribosomal protein S18 acetylase RimI-like enzyme